MAAEQGDAKAAFNLGEMYLRGHGTRIDYAVAVKWYRIGADKRLPEAQFNLAVMYGNGQGVRRDMTEAYKWFWLAAEQDYQGAEWNLYRAGKRMSDARIAEAVRRANAWLDAR